MRVFVSYSRHDTDVARRLINDIRSGGHEPWFDEDLHVGEKWWDSILTQIRNSEVFVFALSRWSSPSEACSAELAYAQALEIPVVPVQIGPVDALELTPVPELEVIDYQEPTSASGARLATAIREHGALRGDLPNPLPEPPDRPFAYLERLRSLIAVRTLPSEKHGAIIGELRQTLDNEDDHRARANARSLLIQLREHPQHTIQTVSYIDEALSKAAASDPAAVDKPDAEVRVTTPSRRLPRPALVTLVALLSATALAVAVGLWSDRTGSGAPRLAEDPPDVAPSVLSEIPVGVEPTELVVSPDGRRLFVAIQETNSVSVVDLTAGAATDLPISTDPAPTGLGLVPDGTRLYVGSPGSDTVTVIDTETGKRVGSPLTAVTNPEGLAVTPDGRRVYVANDTATTVTVIDVETRQTSSISVDGDPDGLAIAPDGQRVYVTVTFGNSVLAIDTESGASIGSPITVGRRPTSIAVGSDSRRAYVTNSESGTVSVIDTATAATVAEIQVGQGPDAVAVSPDGRRAYVANSGSATVSVIDTDTDSVVGAPLPVGEAPSGVAFTSDGRRAYVANSGSNTVSVIDTGLR